MTEQEEQKYREAMAAGKDGLPSLNKEQQDTVIKIAPRLQELRDLIDSLPIQHRVAIWKGLAETCRQNSVGSLLTEIMGKLDHELLEKMSRNDQPGVAIPQVV